MRKEFYVPMITLLLLLTSCGGSKGEEVSDVRSLYQNMEGCTMEAMVSCDQEGLEWEADLTCEYIPGGESSVEVLSPETIAGVRAIFTDRDWRLEYEDVCLNIGTLSQEKVSPALCLPRLISAIRDGWLLEKNEEKLGDIPCLRIALDQSGPQGGKIISTLWMRQDDGTPLRGEIAVDGEIILKAEFTEFAFYDTIGPSEKAAEP